MKTLELDFKKNGFHYKQVFREGDLAVYQQTIGGLNWFETVIIQKNKDRIIAGNTIPEGESMPGSEQWGAKGWTYYELSMALSKVADIRKSREDRKNGITQQ